MPTYDYQCRSCGHTVEVIHSMLEEGPTTCERCGGELRRVIHASGIIFKGSGFYKTDSRATGGASSTSKTPAAASDGSGAGSGTSTTEGGGSDAAKPPASKPASETKPTGST